MDKEKETMDLVNDLNLILTHIRKNGGSFLTFIKVKFKLDEENTSPGFMCLDNLDITEILESFVTFLEFIKMSLKNSECNCEDCQKARIILNNIVDNIKIEKRQR
jgi:hypothetical protein